MTSESTTDHGHIIFNCKLDRRPRAKAYEYWGKRVSLTKWTLVPDPLLIGCYFGCVCGRMTRINFRVATVRSQPFYCKSNNQNISHTLSYVCDLPVSIWTPT